MNIQVDKDRYIESFSLFGGTFENGIEVDNPENEQDFIEQYRAYKYENGKLILDAERLKELQYEGKLSEIRQHREQECFPVINRGEAWYKTLSDEQKEELQDWYQKWLDATETLIEPEMPTWLKG